MKINLDDDHITKFEDQRSCLKETRVKYCGINSSEEKIKKLETSLSVLTEEINKLKNK